MSTTPSSINVTIIDAMFYMYLQVNLPDTFGGIAKHILRSLMNHNGHEIHFVSDKLVSPSVITFFSMLRKKS